MNGQPAGLDTKSDHRDSNLRLLAWLCKTSLPPPAAIVGASSKNSVVLVLPWVNGLIYGCSVETPFPALN